MDFTGGAVKSIKKEKLKMKKGSHGSTEFRPTRTVGTECRALPGVSRPLRLGVSVANPALKMKNEALGCGANRKVRQDKARVFAPRGGYPGLAPRTSRLPSTPSHSTLFDPIRGYFPQKNSQFFYGPFSQNIGQLRKKAAKKPVKFAPKTMRFLVAAPLANARPTSSGAG
jgi:hypothetical protein